MTIVEDIAWFNKLDRHYTVILQIEYERYRFFVSSLRYPLHITTQRLVPAYKPFADIFYNAQTMK